MSRSVALLRGINVGGHNKVPMKALREALVSAGLTGVASYIQSGNLVFDEAPDAAATVRGVLADRFGVDASVMVLGAQELAARVAASPFVGERLEPRRVHLFFLQGEPPALDHEKLSSKAKETERFELRGDVLYLHAPDGVGRSKLAAGAEKALGVPTTARNLRTVEAVLALATG